MTEPLHALFEPPRLELTLCRPDCRNALSHELIRRLAGAFGEAESDPAVRCVILTGAPPAFCAGLDLREVADSAAAGIDHDTTALAALYRQIEGMPKPVLAAVNGAAVAGGAGLVGACDLAILGRSARIGYPGIRQGLVAPVIAFPLLRLVGWRRAQHLLLTGELLGAEGAVAAGLANEAVSDEELMPRVRSIATALAELPAAALARTKQLLRAHAERLDATGAEQWDKLRGRVKLESEAHEGLARFRRE